MKLISTEKIIIERDYFGEQQTSKGLKASKIQAVETQINQDGVLLYRDVVNTKHLKVNPLIDYLSINPQNNQVKSGFKVRNNGRCRFYFRFKRWFKGLKL